MPLTTQQKRQSFDGMVRSITAEGPMPFDKNDIKGAIDAVEIWIQANKASLNSAFAQSFKRKASPQIKALVLAHVAQRMAGK